MADWDVQGWLGAALRQGWAGKGKDCRMPAGMALCLHPILCWEFGVQPGPSLPWGRPVSSELPVQTEAPEPRPLHQALSSGQGPGVTFRWTVLPPRRGLQVWAPSV